ncbi:aconitase family protein [Marinobacter sp. 71-i]|uniref:Aconitase family protein n=1 Tax=Marinobacter iranensis TaxID=2962607 RepID=A0ABT5Y8W9_9GAMM|nr:aconitase family protein [Marinobacter iranensis]MDF0750110.1 aconitase family protein [Marinobacter iranensis]
MSQTIAEKIFSRIAGQKVSAGTERLFPPDLITAYDYPGYIDKYETQMADELGITKVNHPEKFILFIDHLYPAGNPKAQQIHEITRRFARNYGFKLYEGDGIGHQVISEKGHVHPGMFVTHFDGHISTIGALGAIGIGIRNSMIEAFATEEVSLVVPSSVRINLEGKLQRGVTARDVFHWIVRKIGPDGCRQAVIEYGGKGLGSLEMDERFTLCNLAMFLGGISAVMETDEKTHAYLRQTTGQEHPPMAPDPGARYEKEVTINLSEVEPVLVAPPSPANTIPISEALGVRIDSGYIGSCASGRIKDFEQAVEILEGRRVAEGFRLNAVPTTTAIQAQMSELGLTPKLIRSGAQVHVSTCDFCIGQMGALTEGERSVSTGTLNIPGRMGSNRAEIYTASPYTIAATAVHGKIVDPRTML